MGMRGVMISGWTFGVACMVAGPASAGVFQTITIDGDLSDWAGIPLAATDPDDRATPGVDFASVTIANDESNLYILLTLYEAADPFTGFSNTFFDTDNNLATGFQVLGGGLLGSEMLIQGTVGYDERNGAFSNGPSDVSGLGFAPAWSGVQYEFSISRSATFINNPASVFTQDTFAIFFETETEGFAVADTVGPVTYTFAPVPEPASVLLCGAGAIMMTARRRR